MTDLLINDLSTAELIEANCANYVLFSEASQEDKRKAIFTRLQALAYLAENSYGEDRTKWIKLNEAYKERMGVK